MTSISEKLKALTHELRLMHAEALASRPVLERLDYTFDMPLEGDGWYPREMDESRFWRFTGPGKQASLFFQKIQPTEGLLRVHVFHALTGDHIDGLSVAYNGHELSLVSRKGRVLSYSVPEVAIRDHRFVELQFRTPDTIKPAQGDDRFLGIAFDRIEIF